jgi:hypothetical protein
MKNNYNYGIELEFFVKKDHIVVPAHKYTNNLDGDPMIGEVRTQVHSNITDCVFELKKLLFNEVLDLEKKNCAIALDTIAKVDDETVRSMRTMDNIIKEGLVTHSIYNKKLDKILPRNTYKASLQINVSQNQRRNYYYDKNGDSITAYTSDVFDFPAIIRLIDTEFAEEIKEAKRVPGIYAIKNGRQGNRVELRSLPNNINLLKLIKVLS